MASNYDKHVFRQLEDVLKKCDNLSQEIKDIRKEHKKEIKELKLAHEQEIFELKVEHKKEVKQLNEKIDNLENENKILKNDNDRMKAIINKDSTNSSIPPSRDEKPKKRKVNLREKTNRKTGGQKGHKGVTFTKRDVEELLKNENVIKETIEHGNINAKHCITKYEIDTKTLVVVKGHKFYYDKRKELRLPKIFISDVHYGENFKTLCNIMVIEEVISLERIKQFVEILTEGLLKISEGSLVNWVSEKSRQCRGIVKGLKVKLKNSEILYTDLTETKVNGEKAFVRNYSTERMTVYIPSKDKRIHRIKRQWLLDGYTGYTVNDHDTALYNFGFRDKHVECNVHLRRYLKNNSELTKHEWSKKMDILLLNIKSKKEEYIEQGITSFSKNVLDKYSKQYDDILKLGYEENKKNNSKYLKQEELAILNRLKKYKSNHLLYAYNFRLPFDNNLSERDLRPIKTKKKVSGGHRNYRNLKDYCNIRSIISTCKKQGLDYFKVLVDIGEGNPITIF